MSTLSLPPANAFWCTADSSAVLLTTKGVPAKPETTKTTKSSHVKETKGDHRNEEKEGGSAVKNKSKRKRRTIIGMPKPDKKKIKEESETKTAWPGEKGINAPVVWRDAKPSIPFPDGAVGSGIYHMRRSDGTVRFKRIHASSNNAALEAFGKLRPAHLAAWMEETWLFHGTTLDRVDSIFASGFKAGAGAFGRGVYLTREVATAREYADSRSAARGKKPVLIAGRVLMDSRVDQTSQPDYILIDSPARILPAFAVTYHKTTKKSKK
jgi:hypothetical protein